jgi:hypothetical protein
VGPVGSGGALGSGRPRQRAQVWRRVGGGGALREKEGVGERYNEVRVPMQIKSCN